MSAIAFDTHAFVKRLTKAGMPEPQAEILAEEQAKLIDEKLATKSDMVKLETAMKIDVAEAKNEILKWMVGLIGFQTAAILGAVAALYHFSH